MVGAAPRIAGKPRSGTSPQESGFQRPGPYPRRRVVPKRPRAAGGVPHHPPHGPERTSPLLRLREAFPDGVAAVRDLVTYGIPERTAYDDASKGVRGNGSCPESCSCSPVVPTNDQLTYAALFLCGPEAMVTGIQACRRHGLRRGPVRRTADPRPEIHILVPDCRRCAPWSSCTWSARVDCRHRSCARESRSHRWYAPARTPHAGYSSSAEVTEFFPMLCSTGCARSRTVRGSSRPGRGEAQQFLALFWPILRRRAVRSGTSGEAVVAEHRAARAVVERRDLDADGGHSGVRGLLAGRGRDGLGDRVERVALSLSPTSTPCGGRPVHRRRRRLRRIQTQDGLHRRAPGVRHTSCRLHQACRDHVTLVDRRRHCETRRRSPCRKATFRTVSLP